ncbi:MAG TPA: hypothetical protein VK604_08270 [Bryobacteraceae bacterium]|nr:hypothetical protein [Bryobacteraceae bacterium]
MSSTPEAARQTKIFGMRIGVDPKILGGGLVVLTLLFLWFNLHGGDEEEHSPNAGAAPAAKLRVSTSTPRPSARRSSAAPRDRGALSMKPVDPTRGDIDPTLRLSLLERVKGVQFQGGGRNLFDGTEMADGNLPPAPKGPKMIPRALPTAPVIDLQHSAAVMPQVNVPFKYYGFVKPASHGDSNRGFFMEGDNVLVGIEGDVLLSRYLIVTLTPNLARIEDTQMKQGQDLTVAPEAVAQ